MFKLKYYLFALLLALLFSFESYATITDYEIEQKSESKTEQINKPQNDIKSDEKLERKDIVFEKPTSMELSVGKPCDKSGLVSLPDVGGRFMDIRTFAYRVCAINNWSLIVSCDVTENLREVKGKSVREALNYYLQNTGFYWCLSGDCLYIAAKRELEDFFVILPRMHKMLPQGNKDGTFTGNFTFIELSLLCDFLCSVSGINIKPVNDLASYHIMMRVKNINWKDLIAAIICLNRFQMNTTDYSVLIGPEPLN